MGLESGTYISDLDAANPLGTDPKSQGDDHIRLLKATVKASFPNVTGAMTATHTELNYSVGVTSSIQTQINTKGAIAGQAWTGSHTFPTQSAGDNTTKAATTAYVDAADALKANLASPALTGTPTAPTAASSTNTTQLATCAFVQSVATTAAIPNQSGNSGKFLTTDGSNASWGAPLPSQSGNANKVLTTDGTNTSWAVAPSAPDVVVQDQKTAGVAGSTLAAGSWTTRDLNTIIRNVGSAASLGSNAVTLPAGTWHISARASFQSPNGGSCIARLRLYNSTDAAEIIRGEQATVADTAGDILQVSAVVVLGSAKALTLDCYIVAALPAAGGVAMSSGTEVYATFEATRVA